MRNIVQYPITKKEILDWLKFQIEVEEGSEDLIIGDMTLLILDELVKIVKKYEVKEECTYRRDTTSPDNA